MENIWNWNSGLGLGSGIGIGMQIGHVQGWVLSGAELDIPVPEIHLWT